MSLKALKKAVWEANQGIFKAGLVTMHSGNASGIDRARGLVVIKPSGMDYDKMRPSDMVVTDLKGKSIDNKWRPSVDLPHHLYLYKNRPDIGGVIHTHSNYATSFALLGRSIPAYLTAIADEFGGEIPCVPYIDNHGDNIGQAILKHIGTSPAVLLANHGAFAIGKTPRDALKAAVMLEDVAHTCHLALLKGDPQPLPAEEVKKWFDRYRTSYGQKTKK
ncbi:MAG TPA: L-ribulose-5-phosphate 4-epimerase [Bryobacteraceae bacterium]|jgi:L-ribulose-5-phosphate 4-epimerase|nr:L-ribulose-5-phosphate 4-epimerase [Bryobacteraceae bacterium]